MSARNVQLGQVRQRNRRQKLENKGAEEENDCRDAECFGHGDCKGTGSEGEGDLEDGLFKYTLLQSTDSVQYYSHGTFLSSKSYV